MDKFVAGATPKEARSGEKGYVASLIENLKKGGIEELGDCPVCLETASETPHDATTSDTRTTSRHKFALHCTILHYTTLIDTALHCTTTRPKMLRCNTLAKSSECGSHMQNTPSN